MPLKKSGSKEAFTKNLRTELGVGKPIKQALAIAYSVKRKYAGKSNTKSKRK
jgi:hypothetical protein